MIVNMAKSKHSEQFVKNKKTTLNLTKLYE